MRRNQLRIINPHLSREAEAVAEAAAEEEDVAVEGGVAALVNVIAHVTMNPAAKTSLRNLPQTN